MFGTKHSKIDCKRPSNTKQMNKVKILELKYGNAKLLGNKNYNQVKLVFTVFVSAFLYQVSIKLY